MEHKHPLVLQAQQDLEHIVNEAERTGIAFWKEFFTRDVKHKLLQQTGMRTFMKALAKERDVPFIYAFEQCWHPWEPAQKSLNARFRRSKNLMSQIELVVPKQHRLERVISPLLLVAGPPGALHTPVWHHERTTQWLFAFRPEAMDLFFDFREKLANDPDPELRALLKLPPLQ